MNECIQSRSPAGYTVFRWLLIAALGLAVACGKPREESAAAELPLLTTSEELEAASQKAGDRMVVLDMYADWCMPCKVLTPVLGELSQEYRENASFYRINIDRSPDLARAFGVRGIPYIVFLKQSKAVYALTGVNPKDNYRRVLDICKNASSSDECVSRLNR